MITLDWRTGNSADAEVDEFLSEVATFDAEQGFGNTHSATALTKTDHELLVRARLPRRPGHRREWELAAHVGFVELHDGRRRAQLSVKPHFRSIGVATALVEQLYAATTPVPGGDTTAVLESWAFGSHPAAERLARRFGLKPDLTTTEMVRPLREAAPLRADTSTPEGLAISSARPEELEPAAAMLRSNDPVDAVAGGPLAACTVARSAGVVIGVADAVRGGRDTHEWTARGVFVARQWRGRGVGRALLLHLLEAARQAGVPQLRMTVGEDLVLLRLNRSVGFHHDQTNLRYVVQSFVGRL